MNKNFKLLKINVSSTSLNDQNDNFIQYRYNCCSLKPFEYFFIQYFCHYKTFNLKDVQKFVSIYFDYYYFKSDLLKHLLMHFCIPLECPNHYKLKNINWIKYFQSEEKDIRQFNEKVKPKE
jgi:hypothetical protein